MAALKTSLTNISFSDLSSHREWILGAVCSLLLAALYFFVPDTMLQPLMNYAENLVSPSAESTIEIPKLPENAVPLDLNIDLNAPSF
jgi:hypothetical protein